MKSNVPPMWLIILLMMFPQTVETIYSPALTDIAAGFQVAEHSASQTLSVYFVAFAFGVVLWGRAADIFGRRPVMLTGLGLYALGCMLALWAPDFEWLLASRCLSAFGVAVGSVIGQTIMRDCYQGSQLARAFSVMAVAIALSPLLGLWSGGALVSLGGYRAVFAALLITALMLVVLTLARLPETRPSLHSNAPLHRVAAAMAADPKIWCFGALVSLFNLMLFSYFSLGPFLFENLGLSSAQFGASGVVLALGTAMGGWINRTLLGREWSSLQLLQVASLATLPAAAGVWLLQGTPWLLLPMMMVVTGFGIAIPNVLGLALADYRQVAGSAGAVFGGGYYLGLGMGMVWVAQLQNLGAVLSISACAALVFTLVVGRLGRVSRCSA